MKSWQRTSDYHVGHYHTIQNRQKYLIEQLKKADLRGKALHSQLKASGKNYSACLTFLVVATPEYIDPSELLLWYGLPPSNPRVITDEELCALVKDTYRFERILVDAGCH